MTWFWNRKKKKDVKLPPHELEPEIEVLKIQQQEAREKIDRIRAEVRMRKMEQ